jgi:hypothetical protein
MTEFKWVLEEVVGAIHSMLLSVYGGPTGIRDELMLQSALAWAPQKFAYAPEADHFDLAAVYIFGLARNTLLLMEIRESHLRSAYCFWNLMVMILLPLKRIR